MKQFPLAVLMLSAIISFSFTSKPPSSPSGKTRISKTLVFPVAGKRSIIGSFWGDVRDGGKRKHKGIDIFARKGTPVVAISDGIIVQKGTTPRGGKILWLRSFDQPWAVYYAHLDKYHVKRGQIVKKGQVLGTVGNTGNARFTPAHLHFGIYTMGGAVNPLPYVKYSPKIAATTVAAKKVAPKKAPAKKYVKRSNPAAKKA